MPNPVVHFQIAAADPDVLAGFYSAVFGWRMRPQPAADYILIDTAAGGISGGIARTPPGAPGYVALYVEVDDPEACLRQIEGTGGRILAPVTSVPGVGVIALFADPAGHPMGLVQSVPDYGHHEYRVYEWPPEPQEGAVVHFEITGPDTAALHHFYRNVFGWHIDVAANPEYATVDTHTIAISGAIGLQEREAGPVAFYVQTADLAGKLAQVEAAGGRTLESHPPLFALFTDPEGHVVGLVPPQE
jgi:hypothetical protein